MKVVLLGNDPSLLSVVERIRQKDDSCELVWIHPSSYFAIETSGLPYLIGEIVFKESSLCPLPLKDVSTLYKVKINLGVKIIQIDDKTQKVYFDLDKIQHMESYDFLVLGSETNIEIPPFLVSFSERVFNFNDLSEVHRFRQFLQQNPIKKGLIYGRGRNGLIVAENLRELGIRVTILETDETNQPLLDKELTSLVNNYAVDQGFSLLNDSSVVGARMAQSQLEIQLSDKTILTDFVVLGGNDFSLPPNLKVGNGSHDSNIFSICEEDPHLSAYAIANQITDKDHYYQPVETKSTLIKFFDYQIGSVGETSTSAQSKNIPVQTTFTHARQHEHFFPGAQLMVIQLNLHKETGKLIGAQIVGHEGVDKRLDLLKIAIQEGKTIQALSMIHPSFAPALSSTRDVLRKAYHHALRVYLGEIKEVGIAQFDAMPKSKVYLLDVREKDLFEDAHIEKAHSIPLPNLREKLDQLPKNKTIIVYSQTGIQSEIATDILRNHGFEVYRLAGDFRLYDSIHLVSDCPTCNE